MIKAKIWNRLSKNDKMYSLVGLDHNGKLYSEVSASKDYIGSLT